MDLHEKQIEILKILSDNADNPLKLKDIQTLTNLSSPSHVHHHIQQLEKKGYLKKNPNNPKDYHVVLKPDAPIEYLPLYGQASCGPDGTFLTGDPLEQIPVYSRFINFNPKEAFLMEAYGDSMTPKIQNGDILIAKKQSLAEDGEIIVCTWDEKVRIKVFRKLADGKYILESLNKEHLPIIVEEGNFSIEGIMRGIISSNH